MNKLAFKWQPIKQRLKYIFDRSTEQAASLTPEIKQFLVPKNNIIVFKELPKNTLGKEGVSFASNRG